MNPILFLAMPVVPIAFILDQSQVLPALADGIVRITVSDVLTLVVIGAYAVQVIFRRRALTFSRMETVTFLLMLTLFVASLFAALTRPTFNLGMALTALGRLAAQAVYLFCLSNLIAERQDYRQMHRMVFVVGLFCALNVYLGFGLGQLGISFGESQNVTEDWGGTSRSFGLVGDSVGFILTLFVGWAAASRKYAWTAFFAIAILLTGTRGAMVCAVVTLVALASFSQVRHQVHILTVVLGVLISGAASYAIADQLSLLQRFDEGSYGNSRAQRLATWIVAARMVQESPSTMLFGVGYNAYIYESENFGAASVFGQGGLSWEEGGRRMSANATNPYLQMLVDGGIAALLMYLWFLWTALSTLRRGVREMPEMDAFFIGAWAWILGLAIGCQWAVWLLPSSYVTQLLWPALAIVIAAQRMRAQEVAAPAAAAALPSVRPMLHHG